MLPYVLAQHWLAITFLFFAILAFAVIQRRRQQQWIERHFGMDQVRMLSFGVSYFGCTSQKGKASRHSGFLLFTPKEIYFQDRRRRQELRIPGERIHGVYPDSRHSGRELHHSLLKIDFFNSRQEPDCAAFKVPYPPQWIAALQGAFLQTKHRSSTTSPPISSSNI